MDIAAKQGFVSLISAGPGDPDLMTLRGAKRLREAQIVLYDDLASGPLLELASPDATLIPVGKRAGRPSTKQDHVNELIISHARQGHHVARLKSGDAGIFGRLEEELTALTDASIPFEIIPGVSTASAAAAAAGIPLTRRLSARRLQFITGADVTGKLPDDINWGAIADPAVTTVVFMGQRSFPKLSEQLIAHGMPPSTPAMFAEGLGSTEQNLIKTTVADLAAYLQSRAISLPGIILFGALAISPEQMNHP